MRPANRIAFYLLSVLIFQEVFFRICFPLPELSNFDRGLYAVKKEEQASGYVRNRAYYWESRVDTPYKFIHQNNGYGFRDKKWKVEKQNNKKRVLFIGDSYVESVMADSTLTEYYLSASSQTDLEVMNAGMLGIGFAHYLRLLTDMVPLFEPDQVVLVVYSNDFMDQKITIPLNYKSPAYYPVLRPRVLELFYQYKHGTPVPFRWQPNALPYFAKVGEPDFVWNDFAHLMTDHADFVLVEAMKAGTFNHHRLNEIKREAFYLAKHHDFGIPMDYLRYYSSKFNFKPIVVYIPSRNQITDNYLNYEFDLCKTCDQNMTLQDSIYNQNQINLKLACEESKIPFLDLSAFIRMQEANNNHLYWNYDGHLTDKGTKLVANQIFEFQNAIRPATNESF